MYDNDQISDEEFLKANPEDVMREIDRQVDAHNQQSTNEPNNVEEPQQETYEQNPQYTEQEGQSDSIDPQVATEAYKFIMEALKASGKDFQLRILKKHLRKP